MNDFYQKTITKPAFINGVGLHTGKKSKMTVLPADKNHGIIFKRVDLTKDNLIKASFNNVSSAKLCTTLKNKNGASGYILTIGL